MVGLLVLVVAGMAVWSGIQRKRALRRPSSPYTDALDLSDAGRDADALRALEDVVRDGPPEPEALLNLAVLEFDAGRKDAARTHLESYLRMPGARHLERARRFHDRALAP